MGPDRSKEGGTGAQQQAESTGSRQQAAASSAVEARFTEDLLFALGAARKNDGFLLFSFASQKSFCNFIGCYEAYMCRTGTTYYQTVVPVPTCRY